MMIFPPSLDCWRFDSHERPNFQTIIDRLDDIAHSNLPNIPDEFHEMQNDWRLEIGDRMEEIRVKEYVSREFLVQYSIVDSTKTSLLAPFDMIWTL